MKAGSLTELYLQSTAYQRLSRTVEFLFLAMSHSGSQFEFLDLALSD